MTKNCWSSGDGVRDLLSSYEFPGDDTPIVTGSALKALEGDDSDIGAGAIVQLAEALDSTFLSPSVLWTAVS